MKSIQTVATESSLTPLPTNHIDVIALESVEHYDGSTLICYAFYPDCKNTTTISTTMVLTSELTFEKRPKPSLR